MLEHKVEPLKVKEEPELTIDDDGPGKQFTSKTRDQSSWPHPERAKMIPDLKNQRAVSVGITVKQRLKYSISEATYYCNTCSKSFSKLYNLTRHQMVHTGERPFECQVCFKSFNQRTDLDRHETIHKDERPFECEVEGCLKAFRTQKGLKSHGTFHMIDRPFKCLQCPKAFKQRRLLKNHEAVHKSDDEKPYHCSFTDCNKGFITKANLKNHRNVHAEPKFQCVICPAVYKWKNDLTKHIHNIHLPSLKGRKIPKRDF